FPSSQAGRPVVSASSNIALTGVGSVTRTTDSSLGCCPTRRSSDLDANIQITPGTATNAVGTPHTLTITVNALNGTIAAGPGTATARNNTRPGSILRSPTRTHTGGGANASRTGVITSTHTGTTARGA